MEVETSASSEGARVLRLGQALLAVFAAFLSASAVVAPLVTALVGANVLVEGSVAWHVARTVFQFAAFALAVGAFLYVTDNRRLVRARLPSVRESGLAVVGVLALLVGQFGLLALLSAAGLGPGENQVIATGRRDPTFFLFMIPVSLLLVGPVEELLFRGVVQGVLRRAWGAAGAVLVASLVFGLVHYVGVNGTPVERFAYVGVAAVLGCVLGYLYERTRNLVVPAVAHGGYNATLFALQYATAVGLLG